jgi:hypothetical protein
LDLIATRLVRSLLALTLAALLCGACGGDDASVDPLGGGPNGGSGGTQSGGGSGNAQTGGSGGAANGGSEAGAGLDGGGFYTGPTVGTAKQFAALAYNSVTSANISNVVGSIGVSAAAMSSITGFDGPLDRKYGMDSLAPNDHLTSIAQGDVTSLVGNIDPRACDADLTDVVGGLTGDITLHPGVTCMNSPSADVLLNGHVYLDAQGDSNAFFILRGNNTLTAADGAEVVLTNGARACGAFWRFSAAITIGKTVQLYGTLIAGTAITMKTGSVLNGRALAQTAAVTLDANTILIPTDGVNDCPHLQ